MLNFSLTACCSFSHGYGRWQDIANDRKFSVINEPFKNGKLLHWPLIICSSYGRVY